jgi:hypothetical protein
VNHSVSRLPWLTVDKARPALWDYLSGLCFIETALSNRDRIVCADTNRTTDNPWNDLRTI